MSKLFKLKKLFKEEQQIKSSSISLKEPIPKSCFSNSNRNISSLSGGISFNGGTINGGKISNGSTTIQKVIVIAKSYNSGYNSKTKTVKTNKEAGASAATHLDYINKEDRNEERSMVMEQFDNVLENEIYSYSKGEMNLINKEDLAEKFESDLRTGKIESSFSFEADDKILEDKDLLKDISKNNKLYVENEAKTGKVKIHLKGNTESLELAINKINKKLDNDLEVDKIKDIDTNIYNKFGEQMNYRDFNKKKKDLKEKGARGVLSLEVSPAENLSSEELKAVILNSIEKMEQATNKNLDWNFTIHTNTEHTHAHIDVLDNKALRLSKEQLQAFKTLITESISEVEVYSKNQQLQKLQNQTLKENLSQEYEFKDEVKLKNFVNTDLRNKFKIEREENKIIDEMKQNSSKIYGGIEKIDRLEGLKKVQDVIENSNDWGAYFNFNTLSKRADELAENTDNQNEKVKLKAFSEEMTNKYNYEYKEDRRMNELDKKDSLEDNKLEIKQEVKRSHGMRM